MAKERNENRKSPVLVFVICALGIAWIIGACLLGARSLKKEAEAETRTESVSEEYVEEYVDETVAEEDADLITEEVEEVNAEESAADGTLEETSAAE